MGRWIEQSCIEQDNIVDDDGVLVAPSTFEDLFEDFEQWAKDCGCKFKKSKVKEIFFVGKKIQSMDCLSVRPKMDKCCNGTIRQPRFNLTIEDDE